MKKILYSLLAVLAMVMSSCSNDDIEITRYVDNLQLQISTQSFYDDFGITQEIKDSLSQDYKVGIYTFIYDKNSNLVASKKSDTKNLGLETHSYTKIEEGVYTVIVAEMLENENTSKNAWIIKGEDNLSTIQIAKNTPNSYSKDAVGLYASELYLNSESNVMNVTPKGIGAIIKAKMSNFNVSDYNLVAFCTKDEPQGRFLSPLFSGDDRFNYDGFNEKKEMSPRGYLYANKLPSRDDVNVYVLEEGNLNYSFGALKNDENGNLINSFWEYPNVGGTIFNVQDGHIYYGGFLYVSGDNITNDCVGELFAKQNEYNKWYVKNNGVKPLLNWGTSTEIVGSYMIENGMSFIIEGLSSSNNNRYFVQYKNTNGKLQYEYRFDKDKTNLKYILLVYSKDCYNDDNVYDYLVDDMGFSFKGYNSYYKGYAFETKETTAMMYLRTDGIHVVFVPK